MTAPTDDERRAHRLRAALHDLPARTAPATLEARVQEALRRRAAQEWWQRSFTHWPRPARGAFLVLSAALIALTWRAGGWTIAGYRPLVDPAATLLRLQHAALHFMTSTGNPTAGLLRSVPPVWLAVGLGAGAALYTAFFALGAVAYRLYLPPVHPRGQP